MAKYSSAMKKIVDSNIGIISNMLTAQCEDFAVGLGSSVMTEEEFANVAIAKIRQVMLKRLIELNNFGNHYD